MGARCESVTAGEMLQTIFSNCQLLIKYYCAHKHTTRLHFGLLYSSGIRRLLVTNKGRSAIPITNDCQRELQIPQSVSVRAIRGHFNAVHGECDKLYLMEASIAFPRILQCHRIVVVLAGLCLTLLGNTVVPPYCSGASWPLSDIARHYCSATVLQWCQLASV